MITTYHVMSVWTGRLPLNPLLMSLKLIFDFVDVIGQSSARALPPSNNVKYQRTNGPVNAHLRSVVYTNQRLNIMENSPRKGGDEALGPFFFPIIINVLSIS